jgi:hypothetical protein
MRFAAKPLFAAVSVAALVGTSALSPAARADVTKDQCVDANGLGQQLRRDGKLAGARAQFRTCANPACPGMVRDDCTKRLDEVETMQPSVVFDVKDGRGHDLTEVRVSVDGAVLTEHLDGRLLQVDPGEHVFVFETKGRPPFKQTLVIREGEKGIHEPIAVEPLEPNGTATAPSTSTAAGAPELVGSNDSRNGRRLAGAVLAAGGVLGIGVGAAFGVLTLNKIAAQNRDCASSGCDPTSYAQASSDHSAANTDRLVSIVGFGVGGAVLLSGALLFFLSPAPAPDHSVGLAILPAAGPGAASIQLTGTF